MEGRRRVRRDQVQGVGGDSIEFRLYEVSKGTTPSLDQDVQARGQRHADDRAQAGATRSSSTTRASPASSARRSRSPRRARARARSRRWTSTARRLLGLAQQLDEHPAGVVAVAAARSPTRASCAATPTSTSAPAGGGRPKKISGQRGHEHRRVVVARRQQDRASRCRKDGNPEIYIINASDGSVVTRITNDKAIDTSPAWSPDGSQIAFVCDRNGGPQIFVVPRERRRGDAGVVQRQLQHDADVVAEGRQAHHRVHDARRRHVRHRHARSSTARR